MRSPARLVRAWRSVARSGGLVCSEAVVMRKLALALVLVLVASCGGDGGGSGDEARFVNCGNGTVEDRETGLLWEEKTNPSAAGAGTEITGDDARSCAASNEATHPTCADPHDVLNRYQWSSSGFTGTAPDGAAFTDFLPRLNGTLGGLPCFAGHCDWRLPVISELQGIMVGPGVTSVADAAPADPVSGTNPTGQATTCSVAPCTDPAFAAVGGRTASSAYWSASSNVAFPYQAWVASYFKGSVSDFSGKPRFFFVRAVRAGSCTD